MCVHKTFSDYEFFKPLPLKRSEFYKKSLSSSSFIEVTFFIKTVHICLYTTETLTVCMLICSSDLN